jgi:hypothetical protein
VKAVPTSATGVAGYSVYQGYNNRGLLLFARLGSATGPGVTNAYDDACRRTSAAISGDTIPNSSPTTSSAGGAGSARGMAGLTRRRAIAYDGASRLQSLTHDLAGTGSGEMLGFA